MPLPAASATHAAAQGSLRQRLREATAPAHARLDACFGALDLTGLADYRRFLETNAAALLPIEQALEESGVGDIFPDWPARSRRDAILSDLRNVKGRLAAMPHPGPFDFGGVLGTMYVLEGSRLGAQYLLRAVRQSPDPTVAGSVAYLRHGAGQPLWKSFLAMLEESGPRLDSETSAIESARRTFEMFERTAATA